MLVEVAPASISGIMLPHARRHRHLAPPCEELKISKTAWVGDRYRTDDDDIDVVVGEETTAYGSASTRFTPS